ncbi:sensor histidine kinase [Paraburkholderia fynbosensis]|uniref:histidine kinase n=1 Tax=Paraburkholderia fynbosensis TaxID=1200993 RepID=A0A6J5FWF2_9BURK|nr:ATP-binding protein [Paraburkholderia fynbosensis]CAB3788143.1 Adaptive-response sensory-kinase SasA [Paraburkholderia fynbosensis]
MINLIVHGKDLMQGVVGFAMTLYVQPRRPSPCSHRAAGAFILNTSSTHERGDPRLGTPEAESAAFIRDAANRFRLPVAANERELARSRSGWRSYAGACVSWLRAGGRLRREMLDQQITWRDALAMLPVPILTVDPQNRIAFANASTIELFGYTREQLVGASTEMLFPIRGLRDCQSTGADDDVANSTGNGKTTQMRFARRSDGEGFHVETNTTKYGAGNEQVRIIAISSRNACREVDRNRKELMHLARVASLGELASSLAHELNQPLTAILSNAQAAQKFIESDKANTADLREAVDDIVLDSCRASEVIKKIRTMVRKGDMELQPVDVGGVVRDIALLVHSDAMAREVSTTFDIAENLSMVLGDKVQLQQVVLNLLLNAFDAVKECDPKDRLIETTVREESGTGVRITVKDRGQGLTADKMSKIFRPFFTTKPQGLGLGLSISRTIVTAHGGRLWAENNEGKGASFHIALPRGADLR